MSSGTVRLWIFGGSLALHGAFALGAVLLRTPERSETVAIELADIKKKKEPPKPPAAPPPPPPQEKPKPPPRPQAQAKVAPAEAKVEAPPPSPVGADGYADLGAIALGATGSGVAVAAAATAGPAMTQSAPAAATAHKVQQLAAPIGSATCSEPPVRPRHRTQVLPRQRTTRQAQEADIEGVVRVRVTVDETGRVIDARVVSSIGYGLDELALDAARQWTFEPATSCGKPAIGSTVIPFRFNLR